MYFQVHQRSKYEQKIKRKILCYYYIETKKIKFKNICSRFDQKISENKFFILKHDLINEIKWLESTNLVIIKIKILDDFL